MKGKGLLIGSVVSSVAASICCIGPFVAVALGLSKFSSAISIEPIRPYLLALAAVLLGAAFYLTFRKKTPCVDGACAVSRLSKLLLFVVAITVVAAAAFPYYSGAILKAQTSIDSTSSASDLDKSSATISVRGMTCASCAVHIQSTLIKAPGVKSVDVSYEKGQAVVSFDLKVTDVEAIRAAIEAIGYETGKPETEAQPTTTTNALAELPADKLKEEFNRLSDKVRVVALLSPTCGPCQQGRGVVGELFKNQASSNLAGIAVWLPMKPKDNPQTAWLESEKLKDERISVRGWDSNRQIGNLFAKPLKLTSTAWDVYLVYAPGIEWKGNQPPKPSYWMHQLQGQKEDTMLCLNPSALSKQVQRFIEASK